MEREYVLPWSGSAAASADVVVIGSGAGGASAALSAKWAGADHVMLLETDPKVFGGTTAKSGGSFWIPNNPLLHERGVRDEKEPTLRFMAKLSYPEKYDPEDRKLGLTDLEYDWLSQYYDLGSRVVSEMQERGVLDLTAATFRDGSLTADYNYDPDMPVHEGKLLGGGMPGWQVGIMNALNALAKRFLSSWRSVPGVRKLLILEEFKLDISYGIGVTLCQKLRAAAKKNGVEIKMDHAVTALVVDEDRVRGVRVMTRDGERIIEARKGVIFGTGGFAQNEDLRSKYMSHRPVDGTAACKGNTGIMVNIARELELDLVHMDKIWGAQCLVEESQATFETESCIFQFRGDSSILVNAEGRRVVNEKMKYDNRVRVHWETAANRFLLLVADKRCIDLYGMEFPQKCLPADPNSEFYIKGSSIAEFTKAARERVSQVAEAAGESFTLSEDFEKTLEETIERYNSFAKDGQDHDFHRGESPFEKQWHYTFPGYEPTTMYPINNSELYGLVLGPQATDTKGGPQIDLQARCMRGGKPYPGLYAVGNASGAISGDAYWSGGVPIASAMITGYVAGRDAADR